ncbi:MAG TPA: hypothetical protein VIE44_08805 [Methylomirabilota bacterium]
MAMHARGGSSGPSNNALLVVECDGPIDPGRVRRALDRFLDVCPWPGARLRRPFPWGRLHWAAGPRERLTSPPVRHAVVATPEALRCALTAELNAPVDPARDAPLRVLLLAEPGPSPARGVLVLTWFHPLMDPRGGQSLLAHLCHLDSAGEFPWSAGPPAFVPPEDHRPLRERGRIGRQSLAYMRTLAPIPPVSPAPARCREGAARFRHETFPDPPGDGGRPASRGISWRLAVVGRAMAELWSRRGLPDAPFLLPVAVDLRRKGEAGPTFGNLLAFHFARFRPSDTADVPALARILRHQMAEAVRDGQIDANAVGMEFLRYRRVSRMLRDLPWARDGELFSFNCADVADFPSSLDRCFGRRVVNAYHVPAVPPRPGIGVFFNRCRGRNNLVVSWIEGVVCDAEVTDIVEAVAEGMGWRARS